MSVSGGQNECSFFTVYNYILLKTIKSVDVKMGALPSKDVIGLYFENEKQDFLPVKDN